MSGFDYVATGPRMGCIAPLALDRAGLLESWHVDLVLRSGGVAADLAQRLGNSRVRNRVISGHSAAKVTIHPELFALARLRRWLGRRGRDTGVADALLIRTFRSIAERCGSTAVFGMQSSSLELFEGRRCRVMEQFAPPRHHERAIAQAELSRFPGWAPPGVTQPVRWDDRMRAEWNMADVIWVPSEHLVSVCAEWGADPKRFRVVPYPFPESEFRRQPQRPRANGRLRVVFAGTLMLEKGVQYIYQALHSWRNCPLDMHFYGPLQITALGAARLSEVGTVHGSVPRDQLLDEFAHSDVLLFPSLSEGSALVTSEAASIGLPVIASRESGAPSSAIHVEAGSAAAIRDALERLVDDPDALDNAAAACLDEKSQRTVEAFSVELGELARSATAGASAARA